MCRRCPEVAGDASARASFRRRWIIGYRARSSRYFNLSPLARAIIHAHRIEDISITRDTPRIFIFFFPFASVWGGGRLSLWFSGGVTRVFFTSRGMLMTATVAADRGGEGGEERTNSRVDRSSPFS